MSLQALLFLLVYSIALVYAVIAKPIFGLYAYILNFFLDPPGRWWGSYLPDLRWSFLAAGATLAAILINRRNPHAPKPLSFLAFKLYVLYVLWMWVQSGWVVDPEEHARGLNFMTKFVLVIYMVTVLAGSIQIIERILFAMVAGGFYLGYLAFSSYTGGRLDGIGGPGINDASSLGLVMAAFAIVAGVLYHIGEGPGKWLSAMALPFILNAIVAASSRASFLALAAGGIVLFLYRPPRETARLLFYGLLAMSLFLSLASEFFWERMQTMRAATDESGEMDKSAASRFVIVESQWKIFLDHPLGAGHHGTAALSYKYIPIEYHASQGGRASHNTVMTVLVDQGIVGILLWIALLITIYQMCRRNHEIAIRVGDKRVAWINSSIAAALAAIFVGGLFSQQLKLEVFYWFMALEMALSHCVARTYEPMHDRQIRAD
ncbi:MAG: O-antigen ligase family protein [Gammaproteobacteria bacterium]